MNDKSKKKTPEHNELGHDSIPADLREKFEAVGEFRGDTSIVIKGGKRYRLNENGELGELIEDETEAGK